MHLLPRSNLIQRYTFAHTDRQLSRALLFSRLLSLSLRSRAARPSVPPLRGTQHPHTRQATIHSARGVPSRAAVGPPSRVRRPRWLKRVLAATISTTRAYARPPCVGMVARRRRPCEPRPRHAAAHTRRRAAHLYSLPHHRHQAARAHARGKRRPSLVFRHAAHPLPGAAREHPPPDPAVPRPRRLPRGGRAQRDAAKPVAALLPHAPSARCAGSAPFLYEKIEVDASGGAVDMMSSEMMTLVNSL